MNSSKESFGFSPPTACKGSFFLNNLTIFCYTSLKLILFFAVSPRTVNAQEKYITGNSRLVRDLVENVHVSIQQWNSLHFNGVSLIKTITSLKVDESFTKEIEKLCEDLEQICDGIVSFCCFTNQK